MREPTSLGRRAFLGAAGTAATVALAGCTASGNAPAANSNTKTDEPAKTNEPTTGDGGGDSDFASEQEVTRLPDAPADEVTVEMTMVSETEPVFDPEITWVNPGGSVTWKNVDEDPHTTTAYAPSNDKPQRVPDGADGWDSGTLQTGETFTQTFDTEGVYEYYCLPHEALGMVGIVVVGHPDTAGQPALASPQDSIPEKARAQLTELQGKTETLLSK
ncbi:MAG: plastocyanin/azurin family copper-binding protein [Salinigranum sp.]